MIHISMNLRLVAFVLLVSAFTAFSAYKYAPLMFGGPDQAREYVGPSLNAAGPLDNGANTNSSVSEPAVGKAAMVCPVNPVVANTNDSGAGSLRQAVIDACAGDTITFNPALSGDSIALSSAGDNTFGPSGILVDKTLTIDGQTNQITVTRNAALQPTRLRLFYVSGTGSLTLRNLTLADGRALGGDGHDSSTGNGGGGAGLGGAIVNQGTLNLVNSTLSGNTATGGNGGPGGGTNPGFGGGGLLTSGNLSGGGGGPNGGAVGTNTGPGSPGGFGGGGGGGGGSAVTPAGAGAPGGFGGGGGGGGKGTISSGGVGGPGGFGGGGGGGGGGGSTAGFGGTSVFGGGSGTVGQVSGNPTSGSGGGGAGMGGAIFNYGGTLTVTNSTLSGNSAIGGTSTNNGSGLGGAIFNLNGSVTLNNSTAAANIASQGGGAIYNLGDNGVPTQAGPTLAVTSAGTPARVTLNSSILAGSTNGSTAVSDYFQDTHNSGAGGGTGFVSSVGTFNLIQTRPAAANDFAGTALTADPLITPLANNGGPTQTHALLPSSPAIDAGTNLLALQYDQRGVAFARKVDKPAANAADGTDIGAYESTPWIAVNAGPNVNVNEGSTYTLPATTFADLDTVGVPHTATVDWGDGSAVQNLTVAEPASVGANGTAAGSTHAYADGPNTFTATITVRRGDNIASTDSIKITVLNVAPTITAVSGLMVAFEGTPFDTTVQFSDPAGLNDTYTLTIDWGDGNTSVFSNETSGQTHAHSYADSDGLIHLTQSIFVTDSDGASSATFSRLVDVINTAPGFTAVVDISATVNEGSVLTATTHFTDKGGANDTYTMTIKWGDGNTSVYDNVAFTQSFTHTYPDGPNSYQLDFQVNDEGTSNSLSSHLAPMLTVQNVAPTLTLSGSSTNAFGSAYTLNLSSNDPGTDTITQWAINWGDGSPVQTVAGNPPTVTHLFVTAPANNTISATATDEDGTYNAGNTLSVSVTCTAAPVVTNTNDSGGGSLRQAVIDACPGGTITFASPLFDTARTIQIDSHISIVKNLTIDGRGPELTTIRNVAPAGPTSNVIAVNSAGIVQLSGLTITGGYFAGIGGGIANFSSALTLTNSVVSSNTIDHNENNGAGGGIYNQGGSLTLVNSTVSGNTINGTTVGGGGIYNASGTVTLTNSTVSGNSINGLAQNQGAGIFNQSTATLILTNSTVSGNTVTDAPGFGGIQNAGTLSMTNSTVTNNSVVAGCGGMNASTIGTRLGRNNIISGNFGTAGIENFCGSFSTSDSNIIGDEANIHLGPLVNNGGPTETHALLVGSSAINAGNDCVLDSTCAVLNAPANLTTDQRGTGFLRKIGSHVDIGAYELQNLPPINVSAGGPYAINEGASLVLSGSASDPNGDSLAYSWDINGDGTFGDSTGASPTLSWTQLNSLGINDGPASVNNIKVRVSDGINPAVESAAVLLTINNTAPNLVISGSLSSVVGAPYTLGLSSSDPGSDTISGWTVNWGDGNVQTVGGNPAAATHVYSSPGGKTITATATDEDGTFSASNSVSVNVGKADTTISNVTDTPDPTNVGQQYTVGFTLNVTNPGTGTPTGTVTVSDGKGNECTANVPAESSCQMPSPAAGVRTLSVTYGGDGSFNASPVNTAAQHTVTCVPNPIVTNLNDSGPGSLRQAVAETCSAGGQNTITFAPGLFPVARPEAETDVAAMLPPTVIPVAGEIVIASNTNIVGPGAASLILQNVAAPSATSRIYRVLSGVTAGISGLTIRDGNTAGVGGVADGGGIWNFGNLTVQNAVIRNNHAAGNGGGGISNEGTVTVTNVTFQENTADFVGGGLGMINGGSAIVTGTTFYNNSASQGGGISVQSLSPGLPASLALTNSTVSGNTATAFTGGVLIVATGGPVTANITSSTIVNNAGPTGSGVFNFAQPGFTSNLTIRNTIVANNTGGTSQVRTNATAVTTSGGYNLISDSTFVAATGDQLNGNPMLNPLTDNGGPTQTHLPQLGSPVIDKGKDFGPTGVDQRGNSRPVDLPNGQFPNAVNGDGSDIGAVEMQNALPVLTAAANQSANEGTSTAISLGSFTDTTLGPWGVTVSWGDASTNTMFNTAAAGSLGTQNHAFPDNGNYTVTVTVTDSGNLSDTKTLQVTVSNLPPTATFSNGGAVVYGTGGSVSFTGQSDPSAVDTTAGFRYAYDFNNDGTFDSGNGTYAGSSTSATAAVPASYLASVGPHTVKGRSIDKDDGFTDYTTTITVNKAMLNVNAVANTKVYGSADPAFASTLSGFQFSDNSGNSNITGAASCARNAGETVAGGPYLITCTAGNLAAPNYAFATGTTAGFTITKANAAVVVTPYNVTYDGQPHTAAATVTGVNGETGAAVGTVNLGNTTHTNAGTYPNDTWTFTGGPNYNSIAATTITDKITTANTATGVTSSVNPVSTGQPVTFTAQVTAPGGGTPTGTVDFRDNNATIPGCGAKGLSNQGAAQCTTSGLTTGSHAITAVYSGDGNFNTSTGTLANAQVVDSPPTAVGTAADITSQGGTTQTVTVVFTDNNAVNVSTLDSNDIRVTGPNGFDSAVTFVNVNSSTNGTPRTATYSFTAPGGTWDITDNGTYTIVMQANQVSDLFPQPVAAGAIGTFTVAICNPQVTTLANAGAGSLREAVTNACNGSVITFAQNLNGTINLTAGEIAIPTNVTIQGPGANVITVSGNNTSRVFSIPPGLSVAINDLTVTGGRGDFGGGIFHLNAALSLRRVVVAGNTATSGSGGGVYNNAGTLTITDSTIASNTGGGVTNSGTLTITNSTVSGNTAGAGVANLAGAAALTSDTVTNNTSGTTNAGGGSFTVRNTIIAGNTSNTDAAGSYISNGYNLIGNAANSTGFNQTGDQAGSAASPINALLSPLSSNGGPTPTHAFSSTLSPAIDKGRSFNLATDQRGSARPADFPTVSPAIGGDNSDIGAFEASVAAGGSGVDGDINRTSPTASNSSDNIVDLKDLQWYDNFVNGTFIPDSGGPAQPLTVGPSTQENQRRDVAPANIAGDGCLNAQDRQQMVLYALSLAAPGAAGGPSVLNQCPQVRPGGTVDSGQWAVDSSRSSDSPMFSAEDRKRGAKIDPSVTRAVRVINSEVEGGEMLVTIEMDTAGDETRGLFTLSFDPSAYSIDSTSFPSANPSISPGDEAPRGTTIAVNAAAASTGRITLLVDFNGAIPSGTEKRLVTLRFRIAEGTASTDITLNPETLQIINGSGTKLKVRFEKED